LGLLGLLSFIWLGLAFFWQNLKIVFKKTADLAKEQKWLNIVLIFVMAEIVIHGLVDAPYFKNDLAVLFWIIISFFSINQAIQSNKKI
jgi:uncharacterized membrane protein YhaH (DUF805 family)